MVVVGSFATVRRCFVHRETPLPLLAVNFVPVLWNVINMALAGPRQFSHWGAVLLCLGGGLYAAKLPERLMAAPQAPLAEAEAADAPAAAGAAADSGAREGAGAFPAALRQPRLRGAMAKGGGGGAAAGSTGAGGVAASAAVAVAVPQTRAPLRLIDVLGHSHMIHHLCYTATLLICGSDFVHLALRHSCGGSARTLAAAAEAGAPSALPLFGAPDARCVDVLGL